VRLDGGVEVALVIDSQGRRRGLGERGALWQLEARDLLGQLLHGPAAVGGELGVVARFLGRLLGAGREVHRASRARC
jgi:hypothetical protein